MRRWGGVGWERGRGRGEEAARGGATQSGWVKGRAKEGTRKTKTLW